MERTKKSKKENKYPLWKKISGGFIRLKKGQRKIKPNEIFEAPEEDIAKYRNQFEKVAEGTVKSKPKEEPSEPTKSKEIKPEKTGVEYVLQPAGVAWFNVINSVTGTVMNESKLRKAEAQKLVDELNGTK